MADAPPPRSFVTSGGELRLSNPGQLELLRGVVERGVPLRTTARGFSMEPYIRDGDVVTVAPLEGDPSVGDVVAVELHQAGRMAIHRVVGREAAGWLVRGDNCPEPDGVFDRRAFVGRVVRVERGARDVRLALGGLRGGIATLSRLGWLRPLRLWPRLAARRAFGAVQAVPAYRRAGRRMAPRVTVAQATPDELTAVLRRIGSPAAFGGPGAAANPNALQFVAKCGGRLAGFVEFVDHRSLEDEAWRGCWLFSLVVWAAYRGMGVGGLLTARVVEEAVRQGAESLLLVVDEDNTRAVGLYLKMGFVPAVIPALEERLQAEAREVGMRRRRLMRLDLAGRE